VEGLSHIVIAIIAGGLIRQSPMALAEVRDDIVTKLVASIDLSKSESLTATALWVPRSTSTTIMTHKWRSKSH